MSNCLTGVTAQYWIKCCAYDDSKKRVALKRSIRRILKNALYITSPLNETLQGMSIYELWCYRNQILRVIAKRENMKFIYGGQISCP